MWKTIVVNTPKTLQQLLPVLMQQVGKNVGGAGKGIAGKRAHRGREDYEGGGGQGGIVHHSSKGRRDARAVDESMEPEHAICLLVYLIACLKNASPPSMMCLASVLCPPAFTLRTPPCLLALPQYPPQVISSLASDSEDRRTMAARCMGELCRKMGERVLARIVPILKEGIKSPEGATRQGVCLGLKEVRACKGDLGEGEGGRWGIFLKLLGLSHLLACCILPPQ